MKTGIYGGTFNPIHRGHLAAAEAASRFLGLDRLFFIPTGTPPHKELGEDMASGRQRLDMVRLGVGELGMGEPGAEKLSVEVLEIELARQGKSYTVDTLRQLKNQYHDDTLYFLMGTDMFFTFQNWREPGEIAKLCVLCAFHRGEGDKTTDFPGQRDKLIARFNAKVELVPLPDAVAISSTQLRKMLAKGEGREFLSPAVYGYILRERLYGTAADLQQLVLDDLRCVALSLLNPARTAHVLGCEETAAALARRWGENEETARRAALFHDCTKNLSREQHLALCRQYGCKPDSIECREGSLLHALTGAAVARTVYGLSPAEASAIRWHTTGKADMTRLEKIIYLADYIEPTRHFCDLTRLRVLAWEDLDRAVLLAMTMTVENLSQKQGAVIHPNSVCARDYLKGQLL